MSKKVRAIVATVALGLAGSAPLVAFGTTAASADPTATVTRAQCAGGGGFAGVAFCIGGAWNGFKLSD